MFAVAFDYHRPSTLSEAVALLAKHGDEAKVLAGGHSLIPAMKLRLARPSVIIDIGRVADLDFVRAAGDHVAIGPLSTHRTLEVSETLRQSCPLMCEVARHVGDVQVRNRGTIGGSLVHADPAADWPAAMLALGAELHVCGPHGVRTIAAADFFKGLMETAIGADEIMCEIRVPRTGSSVAYVKTEQKASGFALCGVAAVIDPSRTRAAIGVTGVASGPYRAAAVESALSGTSITQQTIDAAAAHAAQGADPLSDIHASAEFRAHLARVNTARALGLALSRA